VKVNATDVNHGCEVVLLWLLLLLLVVVLVVGTGFSRALLCWYGEEEEESSSGTEGKEIFISAPEGAKLRYTEYIANDSQSWESNSAQALCKYRKTWRLIGCYARVLDDHANGAPVLCKDRRTRTEGYMPAKERRSNCK
jgi:hypothetical protein